MQVQYFMTPDPVVVEVDDLVDEARRLMAETGVRHLPVMRAGDLVGIISDRDVRNASVRVLGLAVGSVMSAPPLTVTPSTEIVEAAGLMLAHRISALPVVGAIGIPGLPEAGNGVIDLDGEDAEAGRLVGIISTTNCMIALIQIHHEMRLALEVQPG